MYTLPLIPPRADASLWPSHRLPNTNTDRDDKEERSPTSSHPHRRPKSRDKENKSQNQTLLEALAADENLLYNRKQNVRRFGAGWIRPPGVAKTYQAMMDEAAERDEQEAMARREQVMLDLAAAQTQTANQEAAAQDDGEIMEGERDLDDEVPEAEANDSDVSPDEDDSELVEGDTGVSGQPGDLTFNEDSFLEGSMVAGEVEHMLEMEEAEMVGVLQDERDLDDDIPEAGSYEHTETDLSDISSDDGGAGASSARRRSRLRSSGVRSGRGHRSSIGFEGSSSIIDGSSFLRSSPAAARGSLRSRFMNARGDRGN
ncbi:hypothetical protein CC78DRAFT_570353 [Lojkania enalia]|uniref:Apc15p protein-domain-containing protein n=1 Tax=Lojkania enalia TaxID=147567 RepID=A0A9P4K4Z8_9PLEO|nr:hypothetical protein CC78DRAFT_570353 [Didymosphaeria enalia]